MNNKYIFGGIIIIVFFAIMGYLLTETNIKYEEDFTRIEQTNNKTIKATGSWVKSKSYNVDKQKNLFTFYMKDYNGKELKVIYKGAIPNNFESSTSVVVTGKFKNGSFYASDILTKCPSKYETEYEANQKKS